MPSISKNVIAVAAGFAAAAQAFTQPVGEPTWGALLTPDTGSQVVRGEQFQITWDPRGQPTEGKTVSLVLCKGPGANCQIQPTAIAEGLPANQNSFEWSVPCELTPGTAATATGYGMLIIVDGTGEFQFSTQFSVQEGSSCGSSGGATTSTASSDDNNSPSQSGSATIVPSPSSDDSESTVLTTAPTTSATTSVAPTTTTTVVESSTFSSTPAQTTMTTSSSMRLPNGVTSRPAGATTSAISSPGAAPRATGVSAGAIVAVGMALLAL